MYIYPAENVAEKIKYFVTLWKGLIKVKIYI